MLKVMFKYRKEDIASDSTDQPHMKLVFMNHVIVDQS